MSLSKPYEHGRTSQKKTRAAGAPTLSKTPIPKDLYNDDVGMDTLSIIHTPKNYYYTRFDARDITHHDQHLQKISLAREKMSFHWSNINLAFVNSLRRILISHIKVKVLGNFEFFNLVNTFANQNMHPFEFSKLVPVMHNEQLILALELIPVYQDLENIVVCLGLNHVNGSLILEEGYVNTNKLIEDITTDHLKVFQMDVNGLVAGQIDNARVFPNRVLITKLKKSQKLAFRCSLVSGTGYKNAKFSPVCSASFTYTERQDSLPESAYEKEYEKKYDENHEPTDFVFFVHALPFYPPEKVVHLALLSMKTMLQVTHAMFIFMIQKQESGDDDGPFKIESVVVVPNTNIRTSFTFTLQPKGAVSASTEICPEQDFYSYTLGNLLQYYLCQNRNVSFAAFIIEHPKVEKLKGQIILEGNASLTDFLGVLDSTLNDISSEIDNVSHQLLSLFRF
jgi:DNA-directed RNA polymerase subunit L